MAACSKCDDDTKICFLCEEATATLDTSNRKGDSVSLCCESCFLQQRAMTLGTFKAFHLEEMNRRRGNNEGIDSSPAAKRARRDDGSGGGGAGSAAGKSVRRNDDNERWRILFRRHLHRLISTFRFVPIEVF